MPGVNTRAAKRMQLRVHSRHCQRQPPLPKYPTQHTDLHLRSQHAHSCLHAEHDAHPWVNETRAGCRKFDSSKLRGLFHSEGPACSAQLQASAMLTRGAYTPMRAALLPLHYGALLPTTVAAAGRGSGCGSFFFSSEFMRADALLPRHAALSLGDPVHHAADVLASAGPSR